jgi:hypothetical protein
LIRTRRRRSASTRRPDRRREMRASSPDRWIACASSARWPHAQVPAASLTTAAAAVRRRRGQRGRIDRRARQLARRPGAARHPRHGFR